MVVQLGLAGGTGGGAEASSAWQLSDLPPSALPAAAGEPSALTLASSVPPSPFAPTTSAQASALRVLGGPRTHGVPVGVGRCEASGRLMSNNFPHTLAPVASDLGASAGDAPAAFGSRGAAGPPAPLSPLPLLEAT